MDRRNGLAVAFVVVVLVGLAAWLAWPDIGTAPTPIAASASPPLERSAAATATVSEAALAASPPIRRNAVAAVARDWDGPTGNLIVRVEWVDGAAATGVHVYLGAGGFEVFRTVAELETDARGEVRASVPAGKILVSCDRRRHTWADVEPGRRAEASLSLWRGVDVEGVVRDGDGAPVAGARIWLTSGEEAWCAGGFVATADERGIFAVRAATKGQSLVAIAPGFAPSPPVRYTPDAPSQAAIHVDLVLGEPGGALAGRVVDDLGHGVGGAIVAVMASQDAGGASDAVVGGPQSPRRAFTADDGSYTVEGLAPGAHLVEAWAPRFANGTGECTVRAHEVAHLEVVAPRGVTVFGVILDEDGGPVRRTNVFALPPSGASSSAPKVFVAPSALTDPDGAYHLARLPAGELHLCATPMRQRLRSSTDGGAETVVHTEPGEVFEWNAQLAAGATIRGVARWRGGAPMAGASVELSSADNIPCAVVTTNNSGSFRFTQLQRRSYDVTVEATPWPSGTEPLSARCVWPDAGPLDLRAAIDEPQPAVKGSVHGTVVDAGRRIAPGMLRVALESEATTHLPSPAIDGTSFRCDGVEPGRTRVVVMSGDDDVHRGPWFDLLPGEHRDVGTLLTAPGGALLVSIDRLPGAEGAVGDLLLMPEGASRGRRGSMDSGKQELRFDNLSPGACRLMVNPEQAMAKVVPVTVVAGAVATATITLRPAVMREFFVEGPAAGSATRMALVDAEGGVWFDVDPREIPSYPVQLPLGRYTFWAVTNGGRVETTFEMTSLAADQPPVVLQAK